MTYGYLGYKHIEFFGINNVQKLYSDMIRNTSSLHILYPSTNSLTVFESIGDGEFCLVDCNDETYIFTCDDERIRKIGKNLFDYIIERFSKI